jgi:hypothetical protein
MERAGGNADTQGVNRPVRRAAAIGAIAAVLLSLAAPAAGAYYVQYKEQFYELYHQHYIAYPDDTMENIYWLERALSADFANPLYALALIENEVQYEKYRYLMNMHLYLKLIEQYLRLGSKWDKRVAYFYNAPWKDQNLESLDTAESCYRAALTYWDDARSWAEQANAARFRFLDLPRIRFWQDEAARIASGDLDYAKTIERELARVAKVRADFRAMDAGTY